MSELQNKSDILTAAAELLHDKTYYAVEVHSAYYCCYQRLKHIWLYKMGKCENVN